MNRLRIIAEFKARHYSDRQVEGVRDYSFGAASLEKAVLIVLCLAKPAGEIPYDVLINSSRKFDC